MNSKELHARAMTAQMNDIMQFLTPVLEDQEITYLPNYIAETGKGRREAEADLM